ncbi:MAG: PHP domain-containing protein [Candidatus Odinarchaeota archaeon]
MALKAYIKKNKFFSFITFVFIIWILILIILAIFNKKNVIFWENISNTDVSSEYMSVIPPIRYFLEPIAQLSFILEMEFSWLFLVVIIYPILRIIYLILRRKGKLRSKKFKLITNPLVDIIRFSYKVLMLTILVIGLIMLVGYLIQGYFFVSRYFMIPVQIGVHLSIILIIIKTLYVLIKLFHPKLQCNYSKKRIEKVKKRIEKRSIKSLKKEFVYLVGICSLLLSINIILISIPFPTHRIVSIVPLDDDEFLFDFHVHTTFSDGWLTPEERVLWYIEQGISGAAFADHDNIRGALAAQNFVEENGLEFIVFIAEEWTDNRNDIHMNYFGIAEELVPLQSYTPGGPKAMNAQEIIAYVKDNGGYIIVNHYNCDPNPNGGVGVPYTLTQLRDWGVDGFEIINGGSYGGKYQYIRNFTLSNNLICIGGSDIHTSEPLNTFIKIKLSDPTNLTITNIFETMKTNSNHEVIAIKLNPKKVDFPGDLNDLGFYVIEDFINYFLNIDVYQSLSWIIWSSVVYILNLLSYRKIKKVNLAFLKRKIL